MKETIEFEYDTEKFGAITIKAEVELGNLNVIVEDAGELSGEYTRPRIWEVQGTRVLTIERGTHLDVDDDVLDEIEEAKNIEVAESIEATNPVIEKWRVHHDGKHYDYFKKVRIENEGKEYELTVRTDHYGHSVNVQDDVSDVPDEVVDEAERIGKDERAGF